MRMTTRRHAAYFRWGRSALAAFCAAALVSSGCSWRAADLTVRLDAKQRISTQILAADGTVLATLHAAENREPVTIDRIPLVMRQAIVDIEDPAFFEHKGVDYRAVARSIWHNVQAGAALEGGSTLTQQYLKNSQDIGAPRNLREKIREANLAVQLEKRYSKDQILEAYLNIVYFGRGAYGIQAAAKTWFGKDVSEIGLPEAAFLAGVVQAPSLYDPETDSRLTIERRDKVLAQMVRRGDLKAEDAATLQGQPIVVLPRFENDRFASPYFVDYVARFVATDPAFGATEQDRYDALYTGGLRVHTTLDPSVQASAEEAVGKILPSPGDPYASMVVIDPRTGAIKAMVGGRDYFSLTDPVAKFNLATQGQRSPGSAFKPFVLAAALMSGVKPTTVFEAPASIDIPYGVNQTWHVENYEGRATGNINLVEATVNSVNVVYAKLIDQLGPTKVADMARQMGITSDIPEVPSIALGGSRVSPLEMASAYGTLANNGKRIVPRSIDRVTDKDGKVVWEPEKLEAQALPPDVAALETAILTQVVDRGTGVAARIGRPVAGKTGTSQDFKDAWFVGFTPDLVASVWVGFPESEVSMVPPTTRQTVLGGTYPAQIWQLFMSQALVATPVSQFPPAPPFDEGASAGNMASYIGQPADDAARTLQRKGFQVNLVNRYSGEFPPGRVIGSDPAPGKPATAGGTVTLFVATTVGRPVALPDVLGLDGGSAADRLRLAGMKVASRTQADDDPKAAVARSGRVWKQDPAAGTIVPPGSDVTIYVNP